MYIQHQRAWVRLPSGGRIDLLDPQPDAWQDADLALGLARAYRWGGHSIWPRPLSVAQHSLLVLALRQQGSSEALSRGAALQELAHDCDEGLLGFDCITPLKPLLGDGFRQLSERLLKTVFRRYGIPWWTPEDYEAHKWADQLAAASEAVYVAGWCVNEVHDLLGIDMIPLVHDPLADIYGGIPWEPWPADVALSRFIAALHAGGLPAQTAPGTAGHAFTRESMAMSPGARVFPQDVELVRTAVQLLAEVAATASERDTPTRR